MAARSCLLGLVLTVALAASAPLAAAGTPVEDLAWLNAKRAANGLPSGIALNADWSAKCARHLDYMRATSTVVHPEDPTSPHFSTDGNWAGMHSVLASTVPWTADTFIWETAPLHLAQLLAPQLSQVGIADDGQLACVTTWPGYLRPAPSTNSVVTYPGNGSTIYASEVTEEWPITPAEALGLPNPTGPHLYAYAWGPASVAGVTPDGRPLAIRTATLRGPHGPVELRWVDAATPEVGQYLPTASGILIPTRPLDERAAYVATVTFTDGTTHAWGFTTQAAPPDYAAHDVRITTRATAAGTLRIRVRGRIAHHATGAALSGLPVSLSTGSHVRATITTGTDGRFDRTLRIDRRPRSGSIIVTLRAAETLTAAFATRVSRPPRSPGNARSGAPSPSSAAWRR